MVAPVAPHVEIANGSASAPPPPPEINGTDAGTKAPRNADFNPEVPSNDNRHVHRLENLRGIDAMVGALIQRLKDHDLLDNTYIVYTSDNGFHISNHRMTPGKRCGYEADINIPLLIRGPDVLQNVTTNITNSHTDMAPTLLTMMGVPLRPDFDGQSVAYTAAEISDTGVGKQEYVNVEFWNAVEPSDVKPMVTKSQAANTYYNNTYKSLRLQTGGGSFYYSVWCDGEHEFYDMNTDYYQMNNLLRNTTGPQENIQYFGRPVEQLFHRLDALPLVLKGCKQDSCRNAYSVLFPARQVATMSDAMKSTYDSFFAGQPKVSFIECIPGHIVALEGPQNAVAYSGT